MKDIKFTGGELTNSVIFRVDSINGAGNLTVMETYGLNDRQAVTIDNETELGLIQSFPKIPSDIIELKSFATANGLNLEIAETNGEDVELLIASLTVAAPVEDSSTTDTTPAFSGTGTPGATVSILIGATTVTTTVAAAGTWAVSFSVLGLGAKSALVSLVKDDISATSITREFTIIAP